MAEQQQQQPQQQLPVAVAAVVAQPVAVAPPPPLVDPSLAAILGRMVSLQEQSLNESKNQSVRQEQLKWAKYKWRHGRNQEEAARLKALQRAANAGAEHVTSLLNILMEAIRQADDEDDWRAISSDLQSMINSKFSAELAKGLIEDLRVPERHKRSVHKGSKRARSASPSGPCPKHPKQDHTEDQCWSSHPELRPERRHKGSTGSASAAAPQPLPAMASYYPMPQYFPQASFYPQSYAQPQAAPSAFGAPGGLAAMAEAGVSRPQCAHCGKLNHTVDGCWTKHPHLKPRRLQGIAP